MVFKRIFFFLRVCTMEFLNWGRWMVFKTPFFNECVLWSLITFCVSHICMKQSNFNKWIHIACEVVLMGMFMERGFHTFHQILTGILDVKKVRITALLRLTKGIFNTSTRRIPVKSLQGHQRYSGQVWLYYQDLFTTRYLFIKEILYIN